MSTAKKLDKQILQLVEKLDSEEKSKAISYLEFLAFKKEKSTYKEEVLDNLSNSIKEVNLHKQGKIKLQTAEEFLDGL